MLRFVCAITFVAICFSTSWLTPITVRKHWGCWARSLVKPNTIAEGLSVFGCLYSALNVPKLILVFVICVKLNFEHIVEEFVFCSWLSNSWPNLQVAGFFNLVRSSFIDNALSKGYYRSDSQNCIGPASIVSKGSKRDLNVAAYIVARDTWLKFH